MTDCALLELAANAAGLSYIKPAEGYDGSLGLEVGSNPMRTQSWNPLTDDCHALRLAVKLEMLVDAMDGRVIAGGTNSPEVVIDFKIDEDDPYAATRRAIVRAAAEIGKGMKC